MKLGSLTKLDKRNKTTSNNNNNNNNADEVVSEHCEVIANISNLWPIWSNPEAGLHIKLCVFIINSNLLSYEN